ncbi:MAG: thioredoxin domain-containing protein [Chloroflexota bacterium]
MANRLVNSRSPYLRKAAEQPVDWYEWGEEAFERARVEDKPILLSIGGVWCHWCHVMAHESFENDDVARLINEHFVAIKVDRDERPDIDKRYQDVVMRISGSGGWPLTVFLTPEGGAFYGGTYFPPEERWGKVGLVNIIPKLVEIFRQNRPRIEEVAKELYTHVAVLPTDLEKEALDSRVLDEAVSTVLSAVDFQHGGIGSAPKFHHAPALGLLINYHHFSPNDMVKRALEVSLDAMANGGVYDHLLGGFFRYSTDEKWIVPHFEKMLYDNAELLKLYAQAHRALGRELYRKTAEGIVDYYVRFGVDGTGGFYASQDADIGILDEGGYYVFSLDEAKSVLSAEELAVMSLHYDIMPSGEMHHDPSKNVLFIDKEEGMISEALAVPVERVQELISSGKQKLLGYREQHRQMPFIDKTIYTNWNGLMVEAMCVAGILLGKEECLELAELASKRVLAEYYLDGQLFHTSGTGGFLEDYIFFAGGLLELYQATQNRHYAETAKAVTDKAIELFWDDAQGGFFDAVAGSHGYLSIRSKQIFDAPTASANGRAPYVLLLLHVLTREMKYRNYADQCLQAFAALVRQNPMVSPSFLTSFDAYQRGIYFVETERSFDEALRDFRPYKFVVKRDIPEGVMVCEKDRCKIAERYDPTL